MSEPVTEVVFRVETDALDAKFERRLEFWGGALSARMDAFERRTNEIERRTNEIERRTNEIERQTKAYEKETKERIDAFEKRMDEMEKRIDARFDAFQAWLSAEMARHVAAFAESFRAQVAAVDEKYKDLPPRVAHLEAIAGVERAT